MNAQRPPFESSRLAMFLLLGAFAPLAGCGDGGSTADAAIAVDAAVAADAPMRTSIRGNRYCEVLVAFFAGGSIQAEVWGTQGLNSCPAEDWATVNAVSIRTELSATAVVLNGPRHWLIDGFRGTVPDVPPRRFGTLEMRQLATIMLAPGSVTSSLTLSAPSCAIRSLSFAPARKSMSSSHRMARST